jgi:hypothetical protein
LKEGLSIYDRLMAVEPSKLFNVLAMHREAQLVLYRDQNAAETCVKALQSIDLKILGENKLTKDFFDGMAGLQLLQSAIDAAKRSTSETDLTAAIVFGGAQQGHAALKESVAAFGKALS